MDYLTTKQAAEVAGLKPNELTDLVRKHGIEVQRVGRTYLWTEQIAKNAKRLHETVKGGCCIHCGKPWDRPESTPVEGE